MSDPDLTSATVDLLVENLATLVETTVEAMASLITAINHDKARSKPTCRRGHCGPMCST